MGKMLNDEENKVARVLRSKALGYNSECRTVVVDRAVIEEKLAKMEGVKPVVCSLSDGPRAYNANGYTLGNSNGRAKWIPGPKLHVRAESL